MKQDTLNQTEQKMINKWKAKIEKMTQLEMARLTRFAPSGHPCFDTRYPEIHECFDNRFKGMTPKLSKQIGLG